MTEPSEALHAVRLQLVGHARESAELRAFHSPGLVATPSDISEALIDLRGRLDRMEEIFTRATLVRIGLTAAQKAAEETAQDAWDAQAVRDANRQVREYEGAEERYARWRLATLMEIRAARQARVLADQARQVEGDVKTRFYGLRDIRVELLDRQKRFVLESNLEH